MEWIKSFFQNSEFNGNGSLVKLVNPQDNYTKKTEFMSAILIVKNMELLVKNEDYDPDQDQISFISFPLNNNSQLTHYTIEDDDYGRIECIKWVNLNYTSRRNAFYGFEFENAKT